MRWRKFILALTFSPFLRTPKVVSPMVCTPSKLGKSVPNETVYFAEQRVTFLADAE